MKLVELTRLWQSPTRVVVAFVYFAAIAAVVGWSSSKGNAGDRVDLAMRLPEAATHRAPEALAIPAPVAPEADKARGKVICTDCGVIESVQRIDTRLGFTGWCDAAEITRTQSSGAAFGRGFRGDTEPLGQTVAAAIAENRTTTKDVVTTQHRIVVRLRDGRRQVFDESTPRMVKVGERIVVIAGAPRSGG